ncbi:MAG: zinc-binding dehydrogenase [Planctomycetota bacterium]|nr:zinc-binding dehydrogenase [Planctomycetota bacterium]
MTHALAAIFEGVAGQLEFREFPIPEPRGAEILVHVVGCTLCASDRHSFEGRRAVPVPTVLGHEIVGTIVSCGETAPTHDLAGHALEVGDRVVWAIVAQCGECFFCLRGLPQKCLNAVKYGHEALRPGRELLGGLADHCLLVPGTSIVRLPVELPLAVACPASCATATVAAALEAAGDLRGNNVGIFGAGMLGLTACAMARSLQAAEVVCIEPQPERQRRALDFGATRVAAPAELPAVIELAKIRHGFDVVLELSGSPSSFGVAWPAIRIGGRLILVGSVYPSAPVELALEQVVRRQIMIQGVHNYAPRHLVTAVEFLSAEHGNFSFAELVSEWLPLRAIGEAFAKSGDPGAIRIGVMPRG